MSVPRSAFVTTSSRLDEHSYQFGTLLPLASPVAHRLGSLAVNNAHCMAPLRHWFGANAGTEHQQHARRVASAGGGTGFQVPTKGHHQVPPPGCGPAARSLQAFHHPCLFPVSSSGHRSPRSTSRAYSAPVSLSPEGSCTTQNLPRNATRTHRLSNGHGPPLRSCCVQYRYSGSEQKQRCARGTRTDNGKILSSLPTSTHHHRSTKSPWRSPRQHASDADIDSRASRSRQY